MDQALLTEGSRKQLQFVTFAVDGGSLPEWQRRLESAGTTLVDAPVRAAEGGLWITDPDGVLVNLREDEIAPWRKAAAEESMFNFGDDIQRVDVARWLTADVPASPRRLSHMLIFVSDMARSERFYTTLLGLRLSDRIRGMATFLNSGPGDHHVFGFIQSTHPGLHHSSWEDTNFDQMAVGARTMQEKGHQEGWGLGRHRQGPDRRGVEGQRLGHPASRLVPDASRDVPHQPRRARLNEEHIHDCHLESGLDRGFGRA